MTALVTIPAMPLRARLCLPEVHPSVPLVPGHLHVALTIDDGQGPRDVTEADLGAWNTNLDDLLPVALDRLRTESDDAGWLAVDTVPGMALYQGLDGQSSSRALVLDGLLNDFPIAGVAVAVPSPDQLIVVPLDDFGGLDALNVMIASARVAWENADNRLTDQAFWFDGTTWHHIAIRHDGNEIVVKLPAAAQLAISRLAAMGMVAAVGEA